MSDLKNWQLAEPLDAIVFDCDGTLSAIEGVVYLAEQNGVGQKIHDITDRLMTSGGLNPDIYAERLAAIQPNNTQIKDLSEVYYKHASPNIKASIKLLKKLGKQVLVISAGLYPSVKEFAVNIGVSAKNVYAVDIKFDDNGNYVGFDTASLLTYDYGKQRIIKSLINDYPRIAYIGDGANDLSVKHLVARFIGYGGAFYRDSIKAESDFYLVDPDMLQLLPLLITESEAEQLTNEDKGLYLQGLKIASI